MFLKGQSRTGACTVPAPESQPILQSVSRKAVSAHPSLRTWDSPNCNNLLSQNSEILSVPSSLRISALIKIKEPGLIQQQEKIKNKKASQSPE